MRPIKEIEYSFFGCLFDNAPSSILEAVEMRCKKEWFSLPECRLVWTAIDGINASGGLDSFSLPVVWQETARLIRKKKSEFSGLPFNPSQFYDDAVHYRSAEESNDLAALANVLRNGYMGRAAKELAQTELQKLDNSTEAASIITSFAGNLTGIVNDEAVSKDVSTSELVDNALEQFETAHQEYAVNKNYDYSGPGLQTPWRDMNNIFGNFEEGYNLIAARPSVGKTSFVLQLIDYWCQCGYKCAFNCLDMACSQIIKRPMMNLAQLNLSRAKKGHLTPDEFERLRAAAREIKRWDDNGLLSFREDYDVDEFIAWCKLRRAMGKLDIVVVDYIQQMTIRGVEGNENAKLTEISKRIKNFANKNKIPFIMLSQLSRDNVKDKNGEREPRIEDLRGSGSLEQDAFTVTLLHRDKACQTALRDMSNQVGLLLTPDGSDPDATMHTFQSLDTIWVIRAKSQNGELGRIPMVVYNSSFKWFVGSPQADNAEKPLPKDFNKFAYLTADWRFNEEPFLTAERNKRAIFPKYWERIAERICKRMGRDIPESLQQKIDRYNAEHTKQTSVFDKPSPPNETTAYSDASATTEPEDDDTPTEDFDDLNEPPF